MDVHSTFEEYSMFKKDFIFLYNKNYSFQHWQILGNLEIFVKDCKCSELSYLHQGLQAF